MTIVKFTKIKKRKVYETWQHKNRKTGMVSYIYHSPDSDFYFSISCFNKRCGLYECECIKDSCDMYVYYNSLDGGVLYTSFEECVKAVKHWYEVWG